LDTRTAVRLAANEVLGAENFDQLLVSRDIGQVDLDSTPQIRACGTEHPALLFLGIRVHLS
jgi:hypothetical protein